MGNNERITLLSRMREMRERSSNIFSPLFHRTPNTMTYPAQPDGDVGCKTCETLLYVSFTCGSKITKSRQFRQYEKKYRHTPRLGIARSVVWPVQPGFMCRPVTINSVRPDWILFVPLPQAIILLCSLENVMRF